VQSLLRVDPSSRLKLGQALEHPWVLDEEPAPAESAVSRRPRRKGVMTALFDVMSSTPIVTCHSLQSDSEGW
jgi:hypothetical protein